METWVWLLAAVVAAIVAYYFFGRTKSQNSDGGFSVEEAHGWARREFNRSYPDERVASVIGDTELETFFLRLSDGKVGMYRSRRGKGQAIIVRQSEYRLRALPEANGLQVDFPESDFFSGNYHFLTEQDAADVSTWMLNAR
ncbi:hypothetical protein FF124_17330 [Martelella lutilitoris]|uniref:Uncharacterized protein n=1 Tax=Martelella lutilitoris TaxID=2583532 RepID=A0A5C4JNJ2_9HYPH|nr:hypothetical protein [Martelella lutilitoris]TNB46742.1 hypothetical protein FF124_17330 [Martelella lutilitoris]